MHMYVPDVTLYFKARVAAAGTIDFQDLPG